MALTFASLLMLFALLKMLLLTLQCFHSPDKTHPLSVRRPFPIMRSQSFLYIRYLLCTKFSGMEIQQLMEWSIVPVLTEFSFL